MTLQSKLDAFKADFEAGKPAFSWKQMSIQATVAETNARRAARWTRYFMSFLNKGIRPVHAFLEVIARMHDIAGEKPIIGRTLRKIRSGVK